MRATNLVIVVPTPPNETSEQRIAEIVWPQVTQLLLPKLGKYYARFEPATSAWGQHISKPFSVFAGKASPAEFLYFYTHGRVQQENAIHHHLEALGECIKPVSKSEDEDSMMFVFSTSDAEKSQAHLNWHLAMISGSLLPDAGLYFLHKKEAIVTDEIQTHVLAHREQYALCVVTLVAKEDE
ncbi:MAG: hypothetical protein SNI70_07205 [Rikenellaceae bacterium]